MKKLLCCFGNICCWKKPIGFVHTAIKHFTLWIETSDKRNLRNRLWQAGRDNDADHNGTSSQLPKDLGRVPAAFACSGKAAAYVGL